MTNKQFYRCFYFFILNLFFSSLIFGSDYNFDDFDDIISYALNPATAQRQTANWAKDILNKDTPAIINLVNHLNTTNPHSLWEIKYLLKDIGKPAVEPLLDYVSDTITTGNLTAIYVLGEIGDHKALDKLLQLLESEHPPVRSNAALSIGKIPDEVSIDKLVKLLSDTYPMVRKSAAVSIGKIAPKNEDVIYALLENVDDTYYFVRFSVCEAIQKFDTEILTNVLLTEIKNTKDTETLRLIMRILSGSNINSNEILNIVREIFYTTQDELIAEYSLAILPNSSNLKNEFYKKFRRYPYEKERK
ncbi:MAG: HEAT repeat domain-containing protein [Candidatus Hydrogenedentota bacterium]